MLYSIKYYTVTLMKKKKKKNKEKKKRVPKNDCRLLFSVERECLGCC